jgi:hypothetical protein
MRYSKNKKAVSWKRDSLCKSVSLISFPNSGGHSISAESWITIVIGQPPCKDV